jgi:hypothetical protein
MKKFILIAAIVMGCVSLIAQPPQAFKYQAVARTNSGNLIQNQLVSFRISLLQGSPSGTLTYQERHALNTNDYGLASLEIGNGTVLAGAFSSIDWSAGQMFIKVELDPLGGTSYQDMGTAQLLSVPFALYSQRSMDSPWLNGSTGIYYNGANVGIGTDNPINKLEVNGTTLIGNNSKGIRFRNNGAIVDIESVGTDLAINYQDGGNTVMNVGSGNVGIGTLSPNQKLEINGLNSEKGLRIAWGSTYPTVYGELLHGGSGGFKLNAEAGGGGWADMSFQTNGTTKMFIESAGNVGIGTTSPSNARLQMEGTGTYDAILRLNNLGTTGGNYFMGSSNSNWGLGGIRFVMGYGTPSSANVDMVMDNFGRVGLGTTSPTGQLDVYAETGIAIHAYSSSVSSGLSGTSVSGYGIYAQSINSLAGYFSGNVQVTGSLSKGSGSFVIDHPLDPENKLLRHNFVESPENLLIYRGKIKLDENGEAMVELPDYFEALTREDQATVTLTSIGKPFLTGYEWSGDFKAFKIYGESVREVSWVVYTDRDDPVIHELGRPVEEEKGGDHSLCEKGKLLYPKAYGYPETAGRDYDMLKEQNKD